MTASSSGHALVLERAASQDGDQLAGDGRGAAFSSGRDLFLGKEALEETSSRLDDLFDGRGRAPRPPIPRIGLPGGSLGLSPKVSAVWGQSTTPGSCPPRPSELDGTGLAPNRSRSCDRSLEDAHGHLVDEADARDAVFVGLAPDGF